MQNPDYSFKVLKFWMSEIFDGAEPISIIKKNLSNTLNNKFYEKYSPNFMDFRVQAKL